MGKSLRSHIRLFSSFAAGVVLFFLLPDSWPAISRVLAGWNLGVILFLVLVYLGMRRLSASQINARYIEEDETAPFILVCVIIAAVLSLVAIIDSLSSIRHLTGDARTAHIGLAVLTVADSWMLVPTIFTLHYADMFYSVHPNARPLSFPQTSMPVFWDFAYFSFTIAAACQTADVATCDSGIRKVVIAHAVISFLFNVSILGFAINITAGVISGS